MSDDVKSQVQTQFGRAAQDYATSDVHARGESLQLLVELVQSAADWKMLDVATGAGHTALAFAPDVSRVIATDLTAEMLAKTAQLSEARHVNNLETQLADAEDLPFRDDTFDLVTCRIAMHHFPNPRQALGEVARVLKPGESSDLPTMSRSNQNQRLLTTTITRGFETPRTSGCIPWQNCRRCSAKRDSKSGKLER